MLSQEDKCDENLHEFIVKRNSQAEKEMKEISKSFKKIKEYESSFSIKQPKFIETEILKQI